MSSSKEFEPQFDNREYINSSLGEIESIDITPPNLRTNIPVLFAPGWRETPELQKECLREVYDDGRRVLTLYHPHKIHELEERIGDFPEVEVQKAKTLLTLLDAKGIEQTDVISHSEGAINVTIAATSQPKRFRNLVFVAPAGLVGRDSLLRVAFGFMRHLMQSSSFGRLMRVGMRRTRERVSVFKNLTYALKEGFAITSFDVQPLLLDLRNKGVKVAVIFGKRDTVFPFHKIQDHLAKLAKAPDYGFDIFTTKPGGHELYSKPKEIMPQVLKLLSDLEERNLPDGK